MRFASTLLIAAAAVVASFGTASAQVGGQTYAVNLSTIPATPDCYNFGGVATDRSGTFSSDLRDPQSAGRWTGTGAFLSSYLFAGVSSFTVVWGGSGLVLLNFLLFNGQEIDEEGVGVGYTVSGFRDESCNETGAEAPLGIAGVTEQ